MLQSIALREAPRPADMALDRVSALDNIVNHATPTDIPDEPATRGALDDAKLARADLGRYYALLFLPPRQRRAATALYGFWQEISEINDECTDSGVARIKLAWWQEELHEMFAGRARHPVARALAPIVVRHGLPRSEFAALLAGVARHIGTDNYPDYGALREHGERTRGVIQSLAARIAGHTDPELLGLVARLGSTLELIDILQNLGADARRGRIYLPQADLHSFGINQGDLHGGEQLPESVRALLIHFVDRLHGEIAQHANDLAPYAPLLSCRVEIAVAHTRLATIRRHPACVLGTLPHVTPWRLLWIAWRAARRERLLPVP